MGRPYARSLFLAALLVAADVEAHTPGLSWAELHCQDDGVVDAVFVFSALETTGAVAFRREPGRALEETLRSHEEALRKLVTEDVLVTADGVECAASYVGASVIEEDALRIESRYSCRRGARRIEALLYYLNRMTHGHRQVVTLTGGAASSGRVLGDTSRLITLDIPREPEPEPPLFLRALPLRASIPLLFLALLLVGLAVARAKRVRK